MRADDELQAAMADVLVSLQAAPDNPVSYTHLTLPTICSV